VLPRAAPKAIGLLTPWSVYPLPGSSLILASELQSDRLMQRQNVHFPLFSSTVHVNEHANSLNESFNGCEKKKILNPFARNQKVQLHQL
jgi:hypothetical protein